MRVVEEEVSLSQPETTVVPLKEEEVAVPQGPSVVVLPEEEVPPEKEEAPAPAVTVPLAEEEVPTALLVRVPSEGRRCLISIDC
jgi:hypothetical protein